MKLGRFLTRPVVAQIVHIDAIHDVLEPTLTRHRFQPVKQFIFAMETPVRVILDVLRIFKLMSDDVFVPETAVAGELFRIAFVRLRYRRRIGRDRDRGFA